MSILSSILGKGEPRLKLQRPTGELVDIVPGARTLLIGTARTLKQMRNTLREADEPMRLIGGLVWQPQHHAGAMGLPVLGTAEQLEMVVKVHEIERALISLPAAMGAATSGLLARCREIGVTARVLPTIEDQLTGRVNGGRGSLDYNALLDRPARKLDRDTIRQLLAGKRVMITGAGGSIGSELARIIASYGPSHLLLMERAENNLFEIQRQIKATPGSNDFTLRAILHDVTQESRTLALCQLHKPQVIFHAAAHKHVPMMEDHPRAAVENNFFGTKAIADAAHACGAERFVMISTDKAVNPSSVMGATKRLAELYVQHLNSRSETVFTMVRFGNVLGSACSVLPIWTQQLDEGGPLTVTDPRMTRYFMTIPEAAALVIAAGAVKGAGGQVLLLDMGEPIRIVDMAERFIAQNGLEAGRDVRIVFTGARPGEKLFEELAYGGEAMEPTEQTGVRIWKTIPPGDAPMAEIIERFGELRTSDDREAIMAALRRAIPEMQPAVKP